ncbi:PTS sugar transporter subunit IIA [candidate division WOR-3 bacterium]|nr:PTS sugar transporter subunit IIA [candidate division WOR-3 bacterium]
MSQKISKTKRVYELLDKRNIIFRLEKTNKKEMIIKLVNVLLNDEIGRDIKDEIVNVILKREAIESTGIGNGVAIPHIRLDSIKNFYIVLGLSKDGIDFEAIDKKPVHILFLVLSREQDKVLYIRTLARLARLLHNEEFRNGLLHQETSEDVIDFIRKFESF